MLHFLSALTAFQWPHFAPIYSHLGDIDRFQLCLNPYSPITQYALPWWTRQMPHNQGSPAAKLCPTTLCSGTEASEANRFQGCASKPNVVLFLERSPWKETRNSKLHTSHGKKGKIKMLDERKKVFKIVLFFFPLENKGRKHFGCNRGGLLSTFYNFILKRKSLHG